MVALAVGNLLAILGLAASITHLTHAGWGDHGEDVKVTTPRLAPARRARRSSCSARRRRRRVDRADVLTRTSTLAGEDGYIWALRQKTMFGYDVTDGRWYTAGEEQARAHVAVVERNLARVTGTRVGDRIRVETASGPIRFA